VFRPKPRVKQVLLSKAVTNSGTRNSTLSVGSVRPILYVCVCVCVCVFVDLFCIHIYLFVFISCEMAKVLKSQVSQVVHLLYKATAGSRSRQRALLGVGQVPGGRRGAKKGDF
jgi:hypothetical protein